MATHIKEARNLIFYGSGILDEAPRSVLVYWDTRNNKEGRQRYGLPWSPKYVDKMLRVSARHPCFQPIYRINIIPKRS